MHIDTCEAKAANVKTGAQSYIEAIHSEGWGTFDETENEPMPQEY
jgi:hypothetical protein